MIVRAAVRPEGDKWVIDIEGWGVTQANSLDEVEMMVLDYLACMRDVGHMHDPQQQGVKR